MYFLQTRAFFTVVVAALAFSTLFASAARAEEGSLSRCTLPRENADFKGPCGPLLAQFDHVPTLTLRAGRAIQTGRWRDDVHPVSIWAGTVNDGQHPDEPIELEIYAGAWGVLRTDEGWFPATNVRFSRSKLMFDLFPYNQIEPGSIDREIVRRAAALLSNSEKWNRADTRNCPASATTVSIYCAMEKATIAATGGFSHRRPALEIVRDIINERSAGRQYQHLLMDYNNDSRTGLSDVQDVFKDALTQMANTQWLKRNGFVRRLDNAFQPG